MRGKLDGFWVPLSAPLRSRGVSLRAPLKRTSKDSFLRVPTEVTLRVPFKGSFSVFCYEGSGFGGIGFRFSIEGSATDSSGLKMGLIGTRVRYCKGLNHNRYYFGAHCCNMLQL